MMRTRYLLAKYFGWAWDEFKHTGAHYIRQYVTSIQKDKQNFGMGNPRASLERMKARGLL